MKTIVIFSLYFILGIFSIFAQEAGKYRAGVEIGYPFPPDKSYEGVLVAIELKYNLLNNMNVGLKAENAYYAECMCNYGNISSFATTYDYYFHSTGSRSSFFIGAGLGYYFCTARDFHFIEDGYFVSRYNNPTCFIRAGFEIRRFRMSLAYNLIRKPSEINPTNWNRDYVSLSMGFYFGGGKWK